MNHSADCFLCAGAPPASGAIFLEDQPFCCHGCRTVYTILQARNVGGNYRENPLFIQAVLSGLIANPNLIAELEQRHKGLIEESGGLQEQERERLHLEIGDMWCPSCCEVIRLVLLQTTGVVTCIVDYTTDMASVTFCPLRIGKEEIVKKIASLGYIPRLLTDPTQRQVHRTLWLRFVIAACAAINIMMLSYPLYAAHYSGEAPGTTALFAGLSAALALPVVTWCAWPIYRRAFNALLVGLLGMEALVSIGVAAASLLSFYALLDGNSIIYLDSATVIIALVLLGKILEAKAKFSSKEMLLLITKLLPRRCRKVDQEGKFHIISLKDIIIGENIAVWAGEKLPLDGQIAEGEGVFDEAVVTGEALPSYKRAGDKVIGGSLLTQGNVIVKIEKGLEESFLQRIVASLEEAITGKIHYKRAADAIAPWFVPVVLCVAVATLVGGDLGDGGAWQAALAVLMISCPCAIGVAAPLVESHLIHSLAGRGVVIRNRGCLPLLGKETLWVCDKTGTVTTGKFRIFEGIESLNIKEKSVLKAMASYSTHPLAVAIAAALPQGYAAAKLQAVKEMPGRGIWGIYEGEEFWLGSLRFFSEALITIPSRADSGTQVHFARERTWITTIILGDEIKEGAENFIRSLAPMKTLLLSGDSEAATAAVARRCGFTEWIALQLPEEKRAIIERRRALGETICMMGDGINDAMALAAAQIAISVIGATDISKSVSDIVLTGEQWDMLAKMRELAQRAQKIIRQNLFWAFFYNAIGMPLAAAGVLPPLFAAFAMTASSLMVLVNSQRIGGYLFGGGRNVSVQRDLPRSHEEHKEEHGD